MVEGEEAPLDRYIFLFRNKLMITDRDNNKDPAVFKHYATIRVSNKLSSDHVVIVELFTAGQIHGSTAHYGRRLYCAEAERARTSVFPHQGKGHAVAGIRAQGMVEGPYRDARSHW